MKCHILFSEKNKKNISKCRLLKILPRVLSVKKQLHKKQNLGKNCMEQSVRNFGTFTVKKKNSDYSS